MNTEKLANLNEVTRIIHQKWGAQAVQTFRDYKAAYQHPTLSTGVDKLDAAIGGIPVGYTTLLHGRPTSGMTTLTYHLMAQAQREQQILVFLDLSDTFDGEYAVTSCGLDETHLLLFAPPDLAEGMALIRDVITLPYRGLIVLDAALIEIDMIVLTSSLSRLRIPLRQSQWTVVGLLPPALLSTCQPYAALQLLFHHREWLMPQDWMTGFQTSVSVLKQTASPEQTSVILTFNLEGG